MKMNNVILLFVLFKIWIVSISFQTNSEKIEWSEYRKLTFNDFKGVPPEGVENIFKAVSTIDINIGRLDWNRNSFSFRIFAEFYCNESWIGQFARSNKVLIHEQIHFDIAEIYARKLRSKLNGKRINNSSKFLKNLNKILNDTREKMLAYQLQYDKETDHSRNYEKQKEWNAKIAKQLKLLERYKNSKVTIFFKN